jgi:hypothetical protein
MATNQIEALLPEAMECFWNAEGGNEAGVRAALEFALSRPEAPARSIIAGSVISFEIEDSELNVGPVALCADWCMAIEGDGGSFEITHVWVEGKRADDFEKSLAQRWFDGDLASKESRVRKAYNATLSERTADDEADDLGCHQHHQRAA